MLCQHQPEEQAAGERFPPRVHRPHGWQIDQLHARSGHLGRIIRVRRKRAHSARVESQIAVQRALVIQRGDQRDQRRPIGEREHARLNSREIFLHDHAATAQSKRAFFHHGAHG
ncbi:hypothetical protein SDC9_132026 [bioreactor metagenome]|uniref:Uncharacterized protein n=1 Tax=bioreactor metagenome TaxID=1076179 RepID=A0A645D607_9ZZZZ